MSELDKLRSWEARAILVRLQTAERERQETDDQTYEAEMKLANARHSDITKGLNEVIKGLNMLGKALGQRPSL